MKKNPLYPKSSAFGMSRRKFISSCSACAAFCAAKPIIGLNHSKIFEPNEKKTIRIVYSLHARKQDRPDWPNIGFDFDPVIQRINATLRNECSEFDFLPIQANGQEEAEKILEQDKSAEIHGYLVYQMNCWNRVIQTIAKAGKPVLYADFQYGGSGGFLVYNADLLRNNTPNVGFVSSSNINDLVEAVKCFGKIDTADGFEEATRRVRFKNTLKDPRNCKLSMLFV